MLLVEDLHAMALPAEAGCNELKGEPSRGARCEVDRALLLDRALRRFMPKAGVEIIDDPQPAQR
jgi:hypothetical protein